MERTRIIILTLLFFTIISVFCGEGYFLTSVAYELTSGSQGGEVKQLQQRLKNWGYYTGDINGSYDGNTSQAVTGFQKDHGLFADGIAHSDTLVKMGMTTIAQVGTAYAQGGDIGSEQLLARAINGEARGEPYLGQVAVGAVIINRTRDSRFPKTIAGVIYQPGAFTAVDDGQINVPLEENSTVVKAARDALNGFDPTGGCVYYFNPATATSSWIWSRQIVKQIGKHNFAK